MNHMRAFDSSPSAGQLSGMGVKRMSSMGLNDGDAATPRMPPAPALIMMPSKKTVKTTPTTVEEQEEQDDEIHLTFWGSIAWLTGITAFVAWVSELLVASIQGAAVTWNCACSALSGRLRAAAAPLTRAPCPAPCRSFRSARGLHLVHPAARGWKRGRARVGHHLCR